MRRLVRSTVVAGATALLLGAAGASASAEATAAGERSQAAYYNATFNTDGVNIRSCASTSCTVVGAGYTGHHLNACWANSDWAWVNNLSTGVAGYVDIDLIKQLDYIQECLG